MLHFSSTRSTPSTPKYTLAFRYYYWLYTIKARHTADYTHSLSFSLCVFSFLYFHYSVKYARFIFFVSRYIYCYRCCFFYTAVVSLNKIAHIRVFIDLFCRERRRSRREKKNIVCENYTPKHG